ncbi:hypothetical protein [Streptomyces sp. NPDC001508]|uniref:hypothetical protein n=1 Tax=Streptomyces sp. NPDC001508 TaxID=3154656 RepID=UPI00332BFA6A
MHAEGNDLRDRLLSLTEVPRVHAVILWLAPDPATVWSKLAELSPEVAGHYWREFSYFWLGSDFPRALDAARSLLSAGHPAAALDVILLYDREEESIEAAEIVVTGLEDLIAARLSDPEIGDSVHASRISLRCRPGTTSALGLNESSIWSDNYSLRSGSMLRPRRSIRRWLRTLRRSRIW